MANRICQVVSSLRTGGMERVVCDLLASLGKDADDRGQVTEGPNAVSRDSGVSAEQRVPDGPFSNSLFCTDAEGELYGGAQVREKACGYRHPGLLVIDWRLVGRLVRFVREQRVDVMHAHNHAPNIYCAIVSVLTGIPYIVTRHGQGHKSFRWKVMTRLLSLRARKVVFVSEDARRLAIANHTVSPEKSVVIHNGIDAGRFGAMTSVPGYRDTGVRLELKVPRDAVVIGSVGRLSLEKNYPLLVRAVARLIGVCRPPVFLVLVGDGADRGRIEKELKLKDMAAHCLITGIVADVRPWLQAMDVFCLSSDTEGLSISLLEAGITGLPAVVTDVGGNREVVVDGDTGIVTRKGDEDGLVAALRRLVENPGLREQMGLCARERVGNQFSLESTADRYKRLYLATQGRYFKKRGMKQDE